MKCCAYILNLIIHQGFCVIHNGVDTMRESVVYYIETPKIVEIFKKVIDGLYISNKQKLVLDCKI